MMIQQSSTECHTTDVATRNARWDAAAAELQQLYQQEFQTLTALGAHPFIRDNGGMLFAIESGLGADEDPDDALYLVATSIDYDLATERNTITAWSVSIYERATDDPLGHGTHPTDMLTAYHRALADYRPERATP